MRGGMSPYLLFGGKYEMFMDMFKEVAGDLPGINIPLAKTFVNRGLKRIYKEQMWSFQLQEAGWFTPGLVAPQNGSGAAGQSAGGLTATTFQNTVTGDAIASAAWIALFGRPFITEMQIRSPYYSLYNIISADYTNPTAIVLTLDRPWMEPSQTDAAYMLYQAYFPVPVPDFKEFRSARDTTNNYPMDWWSFTQEDLAVKDPERTVFDQPSYFVPYQVDQRPGSATLGNMLYELWPHPLSKLPYTYGYVREGPKLVLPTDTIPYPLDEESVLWRAKEVGYLWKESQKGEHVERGAGANWQFLAQEAHDQYRMCIKQIKIIDQGLVSLYWDKFRRDMVSGGQPFATITGLLNVGQF